MVGLTWLLTPDFDFYPFGIPLPDPYEDSRTFCEENDSNAILNTLSCAAANNSIIVVVNVLEIEECHVASDSGCPSKGYYLYNSNAVFNDEGRYVARSRKTHPYGEPHMDRPRNQPPAIFETKFGKFATFICFDLNFYESSLKTLREHGVENVAFPTAWPDLLPLAAPNEVHSAWAMLTGVNVLAANIHVIGMGEIPEIILSGSGIYSGVEGAVAYTYRVDEPEGQLVISDVLCSPKKFDSSRSFAPTVPARNVDDKPTESDVEESAVGSDGQFERQIMGVDIVGKVLKEKAGKVRVCKDEVCCSFTYSMKPATPPETYAVIAGSGAHTMLDESLPLQFCVVTKCKENDVTTCGDLVRTAKTTFGNFNLTGTFTAEFVMPNVLTNGAFLAYRGRWGFTSDPPTVYSTGGVDRPVSVIVLLGYPSFGPSQPSLVKDDIVKDDNVRDEL